MPAPITAGVIAEYSIHGWIIANGIKNEKGDPITFDNHLYLYEIYLDNSQYICVMKCAQCGMSTCAVLKNHFDAKHRKLDIIYTLPTDSDASKFVSGKVNRIIQNNDCMLRDVKDKDSIEQKQIGKSYEYFIGTWGERSTDMITADRLVHDEIDTSKIENVRGLQARLLHSKHKETHVFAHPSTPKNGVHAYWLLSDMKEWFITCPHCKKKQFMEWNTEDLNHMSVDIEGKRYRCKHCDGTLDRSDRIYGNWHRRKGTDGARWSGYHITLMMNPDIEAWEIVDRWNEVAEGRQTIDFFYSRVLGLPYAGGGNNISEEEILRCWTKDKNVSDGRIVIGVDTGIALRYVIGNVKGLMGYGQMEAYEPRVKTEDDPRPSVPLEHSLEYFLKKFPNSIMVIDQGGDIVGVRALRAKYPGRIYLCHYRRDRKTMQLVTWGEKDESGAVQADRNRMVQLLVDEFKRGGIPLYNGTNKEEWHTYALHWSHIYRVWEKNALGVNEYVWLRNDRDDYCHATVYFRVGLMRFGQVGEITTSEPDVPRLSYFVNPDQTVSFNPDELFRTKNMAEGWQDDSDDEWRT